MSARPRSLPSWMAKKAAKVREKQLPKSRRKRKTARAAFYCMNEKELVEAAVTLLTSTACGDEVLLLDHKIEDKTVDATGRTTDRPSTSKKTAKLATKGESADGGNAQDTTYVSETDLDITELETVPCTRSPQHQGPEGQGSVPVEDRSALMNVGLEAERKEECSQMPAGAEEEEEDDDGFRLVREIFFS